VNVARPPPATSVDAGVGPDRMVIAAVASVVRASGSGPTTRAIASPPLSTARVAWNVAPVRMVEGMARRAESDARVCTRSGGQDAAAASVRPSAAWPATVTPRVTVPRAAAVSGSTIVATEPGSSVTSAEERGPATMPGTEGVAVTVTCWTGAAAGFWTRAVRVTA